MYISQEMTDEQKEAVLEHLGMDKSMPEQYLGWLKQAVKRIWNLLANRTSVTPQILSLLPATLLLMDGAFLSIVLAIPQDSGPGIGKQLGQIMLSAPCPISEMSRHLSAWDGAGDCLYRKAASSAIQRNEYGKVNTPWDTFLHMIMPCITLSLGNLATFIR